MTKYLIVTGGSRGIGKAVIAKFFADGWQTINISRTPCELVGVKNISIDLGDASWPATQKETILSLIPDASQICLVHNASMYLKDNIQTLEEDNLRLALEFNLVSTLTLNKLLIPFMQQGSSIIYIGSTLSEIAVANRASYTISKHAIIGMMRATCQDLQGKGITTCCVCPGFVNTTMLTDQVEKTILDQIITSKVTAGRLIEPEEIASLVYFCATNSVINGSVIHGNLGQITN